MKLIPNDVGFDKNYLMACMALSGHMATTTGLERILGVTTRTAARRLEVGDFSRQEMLLFAEKCNLDIYDFIRCFFTKMLREEETQKYVLKEVLVRMLVDSDGGKETL